MPPRAQTRAIVVNMPRPVRRSRARRAVARARKVARRHPRKTAAAISTTVILTSAAVGYAQAKGWMNKIPTIGDSRALTIGVAGYAITRLIKNPTARNVGATMMIVGAFDWGSKQGGGKSALEGDGDWIEGDDDDDLDGDEDDDDI